MSPVRIKLYCWSRDRGQQQQQKAQKDTVDKQTYTGTTSLNPNQFRNTIKMQIPDAKGCRLN